jgi:RHS repeat-associated protein
MGQLVNPANESDIWIDSSTTSAWLNKEHLGLGWVRKDNLGFPEPVTKVYPSSVDVGRRVQDLNGDGRPDIAQSITTGYQENRRSYFLTANTNGELTGWNSTAGAENPPVSPWNLPSGTDNAPFINGNADPTNLIQLDFNGDGLPDLCRSLHTSTGAKSTIWLNHGGSQLGTWVKEEPSSYHPSRGLYFLYNYLYYPYGYETSDLNGDGLVDILYSNPKAENNLAMLNTGDGWLERAEWGTPGTTRIYSSSAGQLNGKRNARLQDLNGDGFPDLITDLIDATPKVWINQCRKEVLTSVTDGFGTTLGVEYKRLNDPTAVTGGTSRVYQAYTGTLPAGHAVANGPALVVSRLIEPDGLGGQNIERHYYGDLRTDRTNESSLGFGWTEVYKDLYPAGGSVIPRGYSRTETSRTYPFGGSALKSESFVHVGQADARLPGVTTGYKRVSLETSTYGELATTVGVGGTVRRPVQTGSVSERYDLDGTLMARTTAVQAVADFDEYGFLKKSTVTALDGSATVTENVYGHTTTNTWNPDTGTYIGKWHLGRLSSSKVNKSAPGKDPVPLKESSFGYSSETGLLTSEVIQPGHPQAVTTSYTHDGSGNVITKTVSAAGISRTVEFAYTNPTDPESDHNDRFVHSETTALGVTYTKYDALRARVTSSTDLDGLVGSLEYDPYGTKIAVTNPDGTRAGEITRYATNASLPGPVASQLGGQVVRWAKTTQTSGSPWTSVYFDAMGREVAKETSILTSFNGTASVWRDVYVVTQHDSRGRKVKASKPFFAGETPFWTTIGYDPVDRPMATTYPDGTSDAVVSHSRTTLGGQPVAWSTIKNRNNQQLERWEDQHGRMVQSKDPSGQTTTFSHDVEGRLLQVKIDGAAVLTNTWDLFGRKTAVNDIDAGSSSSTYNAFGDILSSSNAAGQQVTTEYDTLGRVIKITKPEGVYETTYRTASPAKGKPASITGPGGYTESPTYDTYGRVITTSTTRFGETFTTQTTYDALGRVSTETDAGGLTLVHDYDTVFSAKVRTREQATNTTLWEPRTVDSSGRVIQQKLAHGVETIRTPNPANDTLTSIYTTGQGQTLQNLAYGWDNNGNLIFRADGIASRNETFGYDSLNRLTSSAVAGQTAVNYTYAANGNLLTKGGDVLNYGGSRIHAVTSATIKGENRTYAYDAAGRVISDTARTYGWASNDQLAWVSQLSCPRLKSFDPADAAASGISGIPQQVQYLPSQGVAQFDFDASGSRARQFLVRTFADTSTADVTTLYLGSYEREISRTTAAGSSTPVVQKTLHRHNLGGAIYTVEEKPGQGALHKLATVLTDHLGSTDVLLVGTWTGSGWGNFKAERQSFNPWGERRSANTWAGLRSASGDDRQTSGADYRRGFTGHEMLDDFGIIHMNGRIYDAELGRFLSPDPIVQVPEFSQNFNRYSYVLNNPLTYTDPTGHKISGFWLTAIVLVVVAVVTWGVGAALLGSASALSQGVFVASLNGMATLTPAGLALAGAAGGAVGGALNAALSGGNFGDILRGALTGAVTGAITGAMGDGILQAMADGKYGLAGMLVVGHGLVGGASNEALGGRFQDGFCSAAAGAAAQMIPFGNGNGVLAMTKSSVAGGTASVLGGGKFSNGAYSAAFQYVVGAGLSKLSSSLKIGGLKGDDAAALEYSNDSYNPKRKDVIDRRVFGGGGFAVTYRDAGGRYWTAYRGTEPSSLMDWATDILQAIGIPTRQYADGNRYAREMYDMANGNITFVGHSLGGGLAASAALTTGGRAITFNAAGVHPWTASGSADIRANYIKGDVLSLLQDYTPLPNANGQRFGYAPPGMGELLTWHMLGVGFGVR